MADSIQRRLTRTRPPRVKITYDVETGGAIERRELPFIVGIISELGGETRAPKAPEWKFVEIDVGNFDAVMESVKPTVTVNGVALTFRSLNDFSPEAVVARVPTIRAKYDERRSVRDLQARMDGSEDLEKVVEELLAKTTDELKNKLGDFTLPESTIDLSKLKDVSPAAGAAFMKPLDAGPAATKAHLAVVLTDVVRQRDQLVAILDEHRDELVTSGSSRSPKITKVLSAHVAEIDNEIQTGLESILHDSSFQQLEARWRGLYFLVSNTESSASLKLRVLNLSINDLRDDLARAVEFDQSRLFKLIYEAEYGTLGGLPYSLLVGDIAFGRSVDDIELLEKLSQVVAAAHAPFLAAASPAMFGLTSFMHLERPRDLNQIFESAELIPWRSFREKPEASYVSLAMPRVLLRGPYQITRDKQLTFTERVLDGLAPPDVAAPPAEFPAPLMSRNQEDGPADAGAPLPQPSSKVGVVVPDRCLWGNPAYALAQRITKAFALYGWTAAIRGVEGGGLVEGLPTYTYRTPDGDTAILCPTETSITDRREKELNDLGFISLVHFKGTDKAAFFSGQSTNLPKRYLSEDANANASISAKLPYVLAASRFAHYVKAIMRDKVGSFLARSNIEAYLNQWLTQYILLDDTASQEVKASYPLRAGRVLVTDVAGEPGNFNATIFLRPHFQLEELSASIRLVAKIPG
jgi:type VI secretion system protein ImpC